MSISVNDPGHGKNRKPYAFKKPRALFGAREPQSHSSANVMDDFSGGKHPIFLRLF
jgi:hypothetical protein